MVLQRDLIPWLFQMPTVVRPARHRLSISLLCFTINAPAIHDVSCLGGNDGWIAAHVSGGTTA
jgi:hypothetical protein